jgi:hypothetical protein
MQLESISTFILATGMRPGDVLALRGEKNIHLNGSSGLIQVTEGKTRAARRMLRCFQLFTLPHQRSIDRMRQVGTKMGQQKK